MFQQVSTGSARDECEAEFRQLLKLNQERIATNEARFEERIASVEEQRLGNEAKLHERIISLEQRLDEAMAGAESNTVEMSPCEHNFVLSPVFNFGL